MPDGSRGCWRRSERAVVHFLCKAEDGIRDLTVTGVQTCALPIYAHLEAGIAQVADRLDAADDFAVDILVIDRRQRHLDALLGRDGARARLDRTRVAANVVD